MHTIRLRAAWQSDLERPLFHRRRFNRPTGIENETVWLAIDRLPLQSQLNGEHLVWDTESQRVDITLLLNPLNKQSSNELLLMVEEPTDLESVRLEIESE